MNLKTIVFFIFSFLFFNKLFAQRPVINLENWQNMDLSKDHLFGISMDRAYIELLKGKTSVPVIVAVIDGGVDINHEDLKSVIFKNTKEIPANGRDDDNNGYVDDIYGWNFMGSSKGSFQYDNIDLVRVLRKEMEKSPGSVKEAELRTQLEAYKIPLQNSFKELSIQKDLLFSMLNKINKENPPKVGCVIHMDRLNNFKLNGVKANGLYSN